MNPPGPFALLLRINALQTWRRFSMAWQHSKLWVGTMLLVAVGYTALSFWLFYSGLRFIETFPGLGTLLTERLLFLLFGLTRHVSWHFYGVTVCLIGLFIVLPSVFGSWAAIAVARLMDRRSFQTIILLLALAALGGLTLYFKPEPFSDESLETRVLSVLDRMLVRTRFAQFPLLPSYWMSSAVLNWTEKAFVSAGFFALVLLSNVMLFGFVSLAYSGNFFYDAASAVNSRGGLLSAWKRKQRPNQPKDDLLDQGEHERGRKQRRGDRSHAGPFGLGPSRRLLNALSGYGYNGRELGATQ